jgi:hypothetical protein
LAASGAAVIDSLVSNDYLARLARQYLPFLPFLFTLRVSGNLQIRRAKRVVNGKLAGTALQPL